MRPPGENEAVTQREMLSLIEDYTQTFLNRLEEMARTRGAIPKQNQRNDEANGGAHGGPNPVPRDQPFETFEDERDRARAGP